MAYDADDATRWGEQSHLGQIAVAHFARGIAVVTLRGEHDLSTQPLLAHALALATEHSNVVVDLSECSFIDSTVISEFIKAAEAVHAGGEQFMLVIPPEQGHVARIAAMVGFTHFFEVHESRDAALARLNDRSTRREEGRS